MNQVIEDLKADGFSGFVSVADLRKSYSAIPEEMGVYVVLRLSEDEPQFVEKGTGGFFKGKDPNVPISELQEKWLENCPILYIGKAGGPDSGATLRERIKQYIKFGQGKDIGHQGGRYIWQLADAADLIFAWKPLYDCVPREVEKQMIADFKQTHGGDEHKRPFANLQD